MRKTLSVVVLVIAFCCPVAAGIIHNPPPEPEPTPTSAVQEPTTTNEVTTGATDTLTQTLLVVVANVLPLL
ncbi:MAG: hypothetical protein QOC99_3889 [Acidobacteriota bacterium]|jgi:hypothetical protein|nr:hypothetical protein [Acidobacteriota bacterium]MDT7781377.1 hypothetical protein [Acidobacteriota bacterium]